MNRQKPSTNPWLKIWFEPRKTLHYWMEHRWRPLVLWFAIINGLLIGFNVLGWLWNQFPEKTLYTRFWMVLFIAFLGALYGVFTLYFNAWLYKVTGHWIGGKGNFSSLTCAIGVSFYPFIVSNLFSILVYLTHNSFLLHLLFSLINTLLLIWAVVLFLHLIGEAHQFSAWKALIAGLIGLLLFIVFFMLGTLIIAFATSLAHPKEAMALIQTYPGFNRSLSN